MNCQVDFNWRTAIFVGLFASLTMVFTNGADGQRRIIEMEIASSAQGPLETQREWMQMLSEVGADRVRSKTSGNAKIKIDQVETSLATRIKIYGGIDGRKLVLPGATFTIRQKTEISNYIQNIRDDGAEIALAEKKAFGLTSTQLVEVKRELGQKLNVETKDQSVTKILKSIRPRVEFQWVIEPSAKRALQRVENFSDEMSNLSIGTALAAMLRPLGLVLVPQRSQGEPVKLHIARYDQVDEHWPIGWPASYQAKRSLTKLYERYPIEIRNFPLDQVLLAVKTRCEVPMLFDYNSIAMAEIDLSKTKVTFVKEKSNYVHSLGKMLNQARPRMDFEIRVDEKGTAFLWISTANPVR
ncbi:MAG: hypothetical protein AAGA30_13070 [Planctomycetota bacterium]